MSTKASSPAATGPAGSLFEGQVGAHYLLSMLAIAEPRGLPGTTIECVRFQRAAEGHPLDDVIVHAHDRRGQPCLLEVQVKRSITFAPGDPVFKDVVAQVAKAAAQPNFWTECRELAVATAHMSHKIAGPYQDVLRWARHLESAEIFFDRLARPGSANDDARRFVKTFTRHLHENAVNDDPKTVWQLLRRFQILVFDFTAPNSASEELAKERAARVLSSEEAYRAGSLWGNLIELAVSIAADGGGRNREALQQDLQAYAYQLAGDRRSATTRAVIAEASRHALEDIDDRVAEIVLTRPAAVAAVHAALDQGGYVEIRGDAGVGKSGILKHFAHLIATQSQVLVLSPGRIEPRGWTAFRGSLAFEGTARELLSDLASDGGALLLLDGLEGFEEPERLTVVDLVREAATVPGIKIVATARRNFGTDEPSWLPAAALEKLGCSTPVVIEELEESEIAELRHAAPRLVELLSDSHPARGVVRNLYRLARLAQRPAHDPMPRTEVEMAQQWWDTADGSKDNGHRERARLIRAMAVHALGTSAPFDGSSSSPNAIRALIDSETLHDFGNDRVAFRHDVLREWAIANLLFVAPETIDALRLERVASPSLSRGVDLVARMHLEGATDSKSWLTWLDTISRPNAHLSWRRAALLSLLRSEIASELLNRASELLLSNDAKLLIELIRTIKAVDVRPAAHIFAKVGVDPSLIPSGITIPSAPSWHRLIMWLLSLGTKLPPQAIPDVADLYVAWSAGVFGLDHLTPVTTAWLYYWLKEIEIAEEDRSLTNWREPFDGKLNYERVRALKSALRSGFLTFCNRTPELASAYLNGIGREKHNGEAELSLLTFRGALAQAVPAQLAQVTATILTRDGDDEDSHPRRRREAFDFSDHELYPPSPAQGPFFDLLTHAPEHGLSLVRRLVDHAIDFYSNGRPPGVDSIVIEMPDGTRTFAWPQSYSWSRDEGRHNGLTSALMALEAWAHSRIEATEPVDEVLADILGAPGAPACYLLVAVDVLISHWPVSREAVIPFLACPELLAMDRMRQANDGHETPDFLGIGALKKEPKGKVNLESLKRRRSRRMSLEDLLVYFALDEESGQRDKLRDLVQKAAARLGAPAPQATFEDPAFMAVHALNRLDVKNWKQERRQLPDGTRTVYEYMPPPAERRHLEALMSKAKERLSASNLQLVLRSALDDAKRSSRELAAAGVAWAQSPASHPSGCDEDEDSMREQTIVAAATIAVRDGDEQLNVQHEAWARDVLARTLGAVTDERNIAHHSGLRYNRIATAFAGMAHLFLRQQISDDRHALLAAAARHYNAAAPGFSATIHALASLDERLPRSILRVALAGCIRPSYEWNLPKEQKEARSKLHQQEIDGAIAAELSWLEQGPPEPDWPDFPSEETRPRRRRRILIPLEADEPTRPPRVKPEQYVDHQRAGQWLESVVPLFDVMKQPWLRDIARKYAPWTADANGLNLEPEEEVSHPPREWNDVYFNLVAHCLQGLTASQVDEFVLARIEELPDEPFFDIVASFQRSVDEVYFNNRGLEEPEAVRIRARLAQRLMESGGWRWLGGHRRSHVSIEVHIGPAIATLFFNTFNRIASTQCYLLPKGIDRLEVFLPTLAQLVASGASHFVALVTLNLLEVSPRGSHLQFILDAGKVWMASYPEDAVFWVDQRVGPRVCALIERIRADAPAVLADGGSARAEVDQLLASMIRIGVSEASELERSLAGAR